ncbi:MAG: polysaccharide biosynthesis/export family protein [Kiritimatiellaeota bacterium]|nr:polysaccharide biosynthesis/export family protein [Kiritimatiellota bacterium]
MGEAELAVFTEDGDPLIRPGLYLRISATASGVPIQETVQEVSLKGEVLMQMVGAIMCTGMTVVAAQDKIEEAYRKYYMEPQVTVGFAYNHDSVSGQLGKSPWGEVLVAGSVSRPGPVNMPPTRDLKVMKALMLAGGITPLGDKTKISVYRRNRDESLTRIKVNVRKIEKGRWDLDIKLNPGDVVGVPESWY